MLPRCPAVVSATTNIMLMLETGATTALTRAGTRGMPGPSASPTASGISISTMSDRAMLAGSDRYALRAAAAGRSACSQP